MDLEVSVGRSRVPAFEQVEEGEVVDDLVFGQRERHAYLGGVPAGVLVG